MISRIFLKIWVSGLLALPIVLLILPANFFDTGKSVCLSVVLLDQQCYGCGMTRAIQHLIHFNFYEAYEFNKLAFIVFPLLVWVWITELIRVYKILKQKKTL